MYEATEKQQKLVCGQYVLAVLAAMLQGTAVPPLPAGLTWPQVYALAKAHALECMVLAGVEPQLQAEPELLAAWRRRRDLDTVQTLTQISEQQRVLVAFSQAGIPVLRVKGSALRALYPRPEYRQMSDIDLVVKAENADRACALLRTLGYQQKPTKHPEQKDAEFALPPYMGLEVHTNLLAPHEKRAAYYQQQDIWAKARQEPGLPGVYGLRPEDEYLYQLAHFLKHYESAGIGLRQVLDLYLCWQAWGSRMDAAYLARECEKMQITAARAAMEQLAQYCFGKPAARPAAAVLHMQQECILSGVYGTAELWRQREIEAAQHTGQKGWKLRYFWQRLFPPVEYLRVRYPRLHRCPWLYPFYWLCRLLDFGSWKKNFRTEMAQLKNVDRRG